MAICTAATGGEAAAAAGVIIGVAGNLLKDGYQAIVSNTIGSVINTYNLKQNHHVWAAIRGAQLSAVRDVLEDYKKECAPAGDDADYTTFLNSYLALAAKQEAPRSVPADPHIGALQSAVNAAIARQASQGDLDAATAPPWMDKDAWAQLHPTGMTLRREAESAMLQEIRDGVAENRLLTKKDYDHPPRFREMFLADDSGWFSRFVGAVMAKLKDDKNPRNVAFRRAHDAAMLASIDARQQLVLDYIKAVVDALDAITRSQARILDRLNDFAGLRLRRREPFIPDNLLRFSFWNPAIAFVGREEQIADIVRFMNDPGPNGENRLFSWWLVTGGGGAGKSRLALEICDRCDSGEIIYGGRRWNAAFLDKTQDVNASGAAIWNPPGPTLIVIDYVLSRALKVRELVKAFGGRDDLEHPVRFLLLEREEGIAFEKDFLSESQTDRGAVKPSRWRDGSLNLNDADPDIAWQLFEAFVRNNGGAAQHVEKDEFYQHLRRIDSLQRPLSGLLLADTVIRGQRLGAFGSLDQLLRALIAVERERWPHDRTLDPPKPLIRPEVEEPALALSTMVRGYEREHSPRLIPKAIEVMRAVKTEPLNRLGLAHERGDAKDRKITIGWVEPDIIGEYFVLEVASRREDAIDVLAFPWLAEAAWTLDGASMLDFARRARQNFFSKSESYEIQDALARCLTPVNGIFESYIASAEARMIDAMETDGANLSEAIAKALEFLRPPSGDDHAAALAFGEFVVFAIENMDLS